MSWNKKVSKSKEHACKFPGYWSIMLHGGWANKPNGSKRRYRTWTCELCEREYKPVGLSSLGYTWKVVNNV